MHFGNSPRFLMLAAQGIDSNEQLKRLARQAAKPDENWPATSRETTSPCEIFGSGYSMSSQAVGPARWGMLHLIKEFPVDLEGCRTMYTRLEHLTEELEPHLDSFSIATVDRSRPCDRAALSSLFRRRRIDLEIAIMVLSTRLSEVPMRSLYPGNLLAMLCESALGGHCSHPLRMLFQRASLVEFAGWGQLRDCLTAFASTHSQRWWSWPTSTNASDAVTALEVIRPSWDQAVAELRAKVGGRANRERRRDPALRRAVAWVDMIAGFACRLAVPRGPERVVIDYLFSILDRFEATMRCTDHDHEASRAICDLFVLEVLGLLEQFALPDRNLADELPRRLEQGENCRRKRIQRARLNVVTDWQIHASDDEWVGQVYPALSRAAQGLNEAGGFMAE